VRTHLLDLQARGVGSAHVARLARVSRWTVRRVRAGTVTRLRPATAARLRQVAPVLALGSLIASTRTHRFLDSLVREGFTHRAIAQRLGGICQQLQLNTHPVPAHRRRAPTPHGPTPRRVRVSTAHRVERLYNAVAAENPPC
jgi:hypothetical protein